MMVWKMIFLFNWVIFRFHVNLPGCKVFFLLFTLVNHHFSPPFGSQYVLELFPGIKSMQIQESDFTEKIIPTENERIRPPKRDHF